MSLTSFTSFNSCDFVYYKSSQTTSPYSFSNITVSIESMYSPSTTSALTYGPGVIYVDANYPNVALASNSSLSMSMFHTLHFNKSCYPQSITAPLFLFYPVGYTESYTTTEMFNSLLSYTTMSRDQLFNYPTMSFTPQGNFITSPFICDRIFSQNGLYDQDENNKNLGVRSKHYLPSESSMTFRYNWRIVSGYTYSESSLSGGSMTSLSKYTYNFGQAKQVKYNNQQKNQDLPVFRYPKAQSNVVLYGAKPINKGDHVYRQYQLLGWNYQHPQSTENTDWDDQNSQNQSENKLPPVNKTPFFFMLKLSKRSRGWVKLQFGTPLTPISIRFWKNKTQMAIGSTWSNLQLSYDKRNPPRLPYFMNSNIVSNSRTMIIYPSYLGISVQPGIILGGIGNDVKDDNGLKIKQNLGTFVRFIGTASMSSSGSSSTIDTSKRYQRKFPSFEDWAAHYKRLSGNSNSSSTVKALPHIFAQSWNLPWDNGTSTKLKLKMYDATASFFFAPLHFLPYSKFRVYFKGTKGGLYSYQGVMPHAKNSSASAELDCSQLSSVWQWSWKTSQVLTNDGKDSEILREAIPAIKHTYFGSLLFSFQLNDGYDEIVEQNAQGEDGDDGETDFDKIQSNIQKFRTFITTPKKAQGQQENQKAHVAYNMPPYCDNKKQFFEQYTMDSYYFEFFIDLTNSVNSSDSSKGGLKLPRLPIQVIGIMILEQVLQVKSLLKNGNGNFSFNTMSNQISSSSSMAITNVLPIYNANCNPRSKNWYRCITNVQVTHNQQGSTGSITLDKYALMAQQIMPKQCIGGLTLRVKGGNQLVVNKSVNPSVNSAGNSSSDDFSKEGLLFTGYVSKMTASDNFSSDTITMTLQGIQKKLTQLKVINPPYWDGDKLRDMLDWMAFYAGINIDYTNYVFGDYILATYFKQSQGKDYYLNSNGKKILFKPDDVPIAPVSAVFSRPAVNFKSGTDCLNIFQEICKMCNHRFVLQPDAQAYIYTQNSFAMPYYPCQKSPLYKPQKTEYCRQINLDPNTILNFSMQPLMNNLYTFVITASMRPEKVGAKQKGSGDVYSGLKLHKKTQEIVVDSKNDYSVDIPWSKAIAIKHQGFLNQKQLDEQHKRNVMLCKSFWLNLKLTIIGNTNIWPYDRITLFGVNYYVTQVSHSLDLTQKKFTTDITMCSCVETADDNRTIQQKI